MPFVDIPGGSLHYDRTGAGGDAAARPLVLLLPQSSGPLGTAPFMERLAERHVVITYDQRGTGASSPAPPTLSMASQAADVLGLLDTLGLQRAALVCHSTGCGIGLSVAADHSDRVSALVLAAPWTFADAHLATMQKLRVAAARGLDAKQYAHFNAALLFPPDYRREQQAGFDQIAKQAVSAPQDADKIEQRLNAILAFDARPFLPSIRSKTLVLSACDDQLMPIWFAKEAADAIPDAELVALDGGGHMILESRAAEASDTILRFLEQFIPDHI